MNCNEILPLICGYLDGENTESENKCLQDHLKTCAYCRESMAEMQANDRLLADAPEAPGDLTWRIMQQVRKEPKARNHRKRWSAVLSAAAVLAVVLLGAIGFNPMMEGSSETAELPYATANEALYRLAPEADVEVMAEGMTAAPEAGVTMESVRFMFAAYLCTSPVAELENMEPLDSAQARTLLPAEAAVRLDELTDGGTVAYLVTEGLVMQLQQSDCLKLLSDNAVAENYLLFLKTVETNTP